jgi:hypothetical protein
VPACGNRLKRFKPTRRTRRHTSGSAAACGRRVLCRTTHSEPLAGATLSPIRGSAAVPATRPHWPEAGLYLAFIRKRRPTGFDCGADCSIRCPSACLKTGPNKWFRDSLPADHPAILRGGERHVFSAQSRRIVGQLGFPKRKTSFFPYWRVRELASSHIGIVVPRKGLWVRIPCPPLCF